MAGLFSITKAPNPETTKRILPFFEFSCLQDAFIPFSCTHSGFGAKESTGLLKKVVFLDRDGTINRDSPDYIKHRSEFEFLPGSIEAVRELTSNGFAVIVITNQSALARNLISRRELDAIHAMMKKKIASAGGQIKDIFFCPHLPADGCNCRKPQPGLILQAQQKYGIDLTTAFLVGDSAKDIECARKAGCNRTVLVKTGCPDKAATHLAEKHMWPDYTAEHLQDAVKWILAQEKFHK